MKKLIVILLVIVLVATGGLVGLYFAGGDEGAAPASTVIWTCPMHPEVRYPENVPCPKCGMELVIAAGDDAGPRRIAMTAAAAELARIETAPVARRFVTLPVRMVGVVDFDETRVRTIAARVAGRLDRLLVDFTGIRVATGDALVELYSPQLLAAQQELIEAKRRLQAGAGEESRFLAGSGRRGYEAAREKLLLWGFDADQVEAIEARGTASDTMTIRSPSSGIVIDKHLDEGAYVKEGTAIYRVADLSRVWIQLDAYEQDLPWLRYGQRVQVTAEALPGDVFEGWISFLDPVIDARKRTVRVRVDVDNSDGRLKPGMFVRAVVKSRIAAAGQVLASTLDGKWICPMHPQVRAEGPGQCEICDLDLVPVAELGYETDGGVERPLVVPVSAALVTGTRAVVYVLVSGGEKPVYEGREVVLGPRAGDEYIVREGLRENERVVVQGAFRVDSAMQIAAKPSMMSMPGEQQFTGAETEAFRQTLGPVYASYFAMRKALAVDDAAAARVAAGALARDLDGVDALLLPRRARDLWAEEFARLSPAATAAAATDDIEEQRRRFEPLSMAVLALDRAFRHEGAEPHYEMFCPMAFDNRGAAWVQDVDELLNPYFGASMLRCGETRSELPGFAAGTPPTGEGGR